MTAMVYFFAESLIARDSSQRTSTWTRNAQLVDTPCRVHVRIRFHPASNATNNERSNDPDATIHTPYMKKGGRPEGRPHPWIPTLSERSWVSHNPRRRNRNSCPRICPIVSLWHRTLPTRSIPCRNRNTRRNSSPKIPSNRTIPASLPCSPATTTHTACRRDRWASTISRTNQRRPR